jgi:nucleoside phosphorylase/tetratricopeptide (TPR) repeat protein
MGKSKVGRNDPCPCGSGKKFKKCHGDAGTSDDTTAERPSDTSAGCDDLAESAQAAWDQGDHESAFHLAQIVFDRRHACRAWERATHLMVDCFLERGKVATAQGFAEANIRFNDVCPQSHVQLGLVLEEQGKYAGAAKSFLRGIQLVEARHGDEEISFAHLHLAQCAARAHRLDMIDPFLRRWRAKPPEDAESMFYFALCLMEAGALPEAEAILSKQLQGAKSAEERAQFEHELGLCALHRGDIVSARTAFQASVDAARDLAHRSMSMLAVVEMKAGNMEGAVRWARNAVATAPNDIAYRLNLAASLAGSEEYEEAIEIYGEVLKDAPDFGEVQESMALAMIEMGDIDGGLANLFALERRGFNARSVSANIGVALARRGQPADLKKALVRHERALERPTDPTQEAVIVLNMLSILAKLGRDSDAMLLAERTFVDWPTWAQEELAARTAHLRSEDKERTVQSVIRVFGVDAAAAMLAVSTRNSTPGGRTAEHYRPEEARAPTAADAAALAALVRSAREPAAEGPMRAVDEGTATTPMERARQASIGLITALPKEFASMRALLLKPMTIALRRGGSRTRYVVGSIPSEHGGEHTVLLTMSPEMGNNSAASRATAMLFDFDNITDIIMVGIAGGVPSPSNAEEHVRLGDIVVSGAGGVVQYDMDKETQTMVEHRPPLRPPSAYLLEAVRYLEAELHDGRMPWVQHIAARDAAARPDAATDILTDATTEKTISHPVDPARAEGLPRLFIGKIASANKLLKNPQKRDDLRAKFSVRAIEMEGSGIADATWMASAGYLVVRGICDYCDARKNDVWQRYAAIVAAAYTRALIQSIPVPES